MTRTIHDVTVPGEDQGGSPAPVSEAVTFLFTDVEGSTLIWERAPDSMRAAVDIHDRIIGSVVTAHGGRVFARGGEEFCVAFARADSALRAAIAAQRELERASWPTDAVLSVRMGLHTGEAHERDGDYLGSAVNRAARVMSAANGRQVVLSSSTRDLLSGPTSAETVLVDLGPHELRHIPESVRLFRVDSPAFTSDPRPPRTTSRRTGNLPASGSALIGRDDELVALTAVLRDARVLTLTGTGGIGKTRLALDIGRGVETAYADGTWLAALDGVDRSEAVPGHLLGLFSIERRRSRDLDSLIDGLRHREALLILDNCEHVLDVAAEVTAAIVANCPSMKVLATSREPLDVEGEWVRRVRSLRTDEDGPAVALFRRRAEEAGVTIAAEDSDIVRQVCSRLDGIPLAIELAAARASSMSPTEILDRLDEMFRLLVGGRRSGTSRHRTLRSALDWSVQMLSDDERGVLARAAVFAGSFSRSAAEALLTCGRTAGDLVGVLDHLVSRSLVVADRHGAEVRYRLLEPIRQMAAELLADRAETEAVREAHARWYLRLMVDLSDRWRGGEDQTTWPIAARELPNLTSAFDHLIDCGATDDAQRFAVAGYGPIGCQFDGVVIYDWAVRAADVDRSHRGPWTGSVCAVAAWGAMARGDLDSAAALLSRGADAVDAGSIDDGLVAAAAIHHVVFGGALSVSENFLARSVSGALASGDLHRQVWALTYSGRVDQAVDVAKRLGNRTLQAVALSVITAREDEAGWDECEEFWEAAHRSHSYLVINNATHRLGAAHLRVGATVDGLVLLRGPVRDWLLRADTRVWDVLHTIAVGLALSDRAPSAARLRGSIGDRHLSAVPASEQRWLEELLSSNLPEADRRREARRGEALDAGAAVAIALAEIDEISAFPSEADDDVELTPRQQEVATLVARGCTNKQIAQRLQVSRYTAETHVRNILERLGAASRSEIAAWATQRFGAGRT